MPREKAAVVESESETAGPLFTVERANRSLVLVKKIVADIVARYRELVRLRAVMTRMRAESLPQERLEAVQERVDDGVRVLGNLHRELTSTGCVLRDWQTGLVDFPSMYLGRRVWLCWRLGDSTVAHWHELRAGFAGRRPITDVTSFDSGQARAEARGL